MTKQETLPKRVVVIKFDFTKTLRNRLFSCVRVIISSILDYQSLVRGDRDSRANLMPIYGDLYQIKL